jgi:hypothetical protein
MKPRMICGARTRSGGRCECKKLLRGGRCKFHGGLSSGPKSEAGKTRALRNLKNCALAPASAT